MEINYFELKYLITDTFYAEMIKNDYSYEQATGICYESFFEYINLDSVESVVSLSTIIVLKLRYKVELSEYDIANIEKIIDLSERISFDRILNDIEIEYLEEDLNRLRYKYKEIN